MQVFTYTCFNHIIELVIIKGERPLKRVVMIIVFLFILWGVTIHAVAAGFDMSQLETETNKELFSYSYERDYVFIDANLSSKAKAFIHKNDSKYYYSTMYPDIIVINQGTAEEYAVPRLWIDYCTDNDGIGAHTLELSVGECVYSFSLDEPTCKELNNSAIRESYLIKFGNDGLQIVDDWYKSTILDEEKIYAKLISNVETIEFEVPEDVAIALTFTFLLFKAAGGYETIDQIAGTPVSIKGTSDATIQNVISQFEYGNEYVFDVFSIRFPKTIEVMNINDHKNGVYGNKYDVLFEDGITYLWALDRKRDLYIKISAEALSVDNDILRTMGCPSTEIIDTYNYILSYDDVKIPEDEKLFVFKTSTTNFVGRSYLQEGSLKYMLKYLWAHDGLTYYLTIDVGHFKNVDVSLAELDTVLDYLDTLNTL